ncbi:MAG: N-acetylmuramoyl-L-alanine amidase [Planctomycetes bacterium]|nr:N-acetylmuramoyl-L-alanine amidase [Planctomycetota bacterium]
MTLRTNILTALALAALGLAGCQEPQKQTPKMVVADHATTLEDLALRLGLRIEERDAGFVVLKNAANTVLIFTHPDGRFFVNGQPIGPVGEIKKEGNTFHVPASLVEQIREHLRSAAPPVVRRKPTKSKALVVLDAGHGGQDPGTSSATGTQEKHINLAVALKVADLLEQAGVAVIMTRQHDRFIDLEARADLANRRKTDLFVSIHADWAPNRSVQGFTIYVARAASADARRAAQAISQTMAATGCDTRGIREADFKVLVLTNCPAVLVELGYLSHVQEAARLRDPAWQNRLAQAIAAGILAYVR